MQLGSPAVAHSIHYLIQKATICHVQRIDIRNVHCCALIQHYITYSTCKHLIIQFSTHRQPVHKLCHWSHQGTDTEGCQIRNSLCSFLHWDKDRRLEWKNREYAGTMGTCTNRPLIIKLPDFPHHISRTYVHMFVHCPISCIYICMFVHNTDMYICLTVA